MVDDSESPQANLDYLEDLVLKQVFDSPVFSLSLPFNYFVRIGAAKSIIQSEVLNILSQQFKTSLVSVLDSNSDQVFNNLAKIIFSGSKAHAAYIDSKDSFDQIVYTIVRNRDYRLVREIYFQAMDSEDSLGGLSRRFTAGLEKATRGIVGPISLNKGHPEICNKIKTAACGQLIKPFYVEGWWICIRIEHRDESSFTPEIEEIVSQQLLDDWINTLSDNILNRASAIQVS